MKLTTQMLVNILGEGFESKPDKVFLQSQPGLDLSELDSFEVKRKTGVDIEVWL